MSRIVSRTVKGAPYYYLEESFKDGSKWVKESVYLGAQKPSSVQLSTAFQELKKKAKQKGREILIPPLTEFIAHQKARAIQVAVQQKSVFLKQLSIEQRDEFVRRQRITFITESNAIEGSSLTYTETERVISQEKQLKDFEKNKILLTGMNREEQEALNLKACLDRYEKYLKMNEKLSEKMILQFHYLLLDKIPNYEKYQGVYRPVKVYIVGSMHEFPLPFEVPALMKELIDWYNQNESMIYPVELAAKFHVKFTSIHPFADGNGRMARLLMNYILQQKEVPFTNIPLKRRSVYMKTQAAGNKFDYRPFTTFLAEEVIKQNTKKEIEKRVILERADTILKKSKLTDEETISLGRKVKKVVSKKF